MQVKTLFLNHIPRDDRVGLKPAQVCTEEYFKDLLSQFDLGEVCYGSFNDFKEPIDTHHPIIVIVPGSYYAPQIKEYKSDSFVFLLESPSWVFSRKAEVAERKQKQYDLLKSVAGLVEKLKEDEEEEKIRKFASMSYGETFEMIKKGIISEDKELSRKAWDLLNGPDAKGDFIWMRAQLIVETWQHADAKGKYDFLRLVMKEYVENYFAEELAIHTDEDGIQYRQYEFIFPTGERSYYIRRIPIPPKGMEKIAYDNLLEKYETPNGARMLLEKGQTMSQMKPHTDVEAQKIFEILRKWKDDPMTSQRDLNILDHDGCFSDKPLSEYHVGVFKKILKVWGEDKYNELFPE